MYNIAKRIKVFEKTNGHCIYCGEEISINNFHIEHFKAKSKIQGNCSDIKNLFPSCPECNYIKSDLSIDEFRKKLEELPNKNCLTKTISKYYDLKPKKIKFYFEKNRVCIPYQKK